MKKKIMINRIVSVLVALLLIATDIVMPQNAVASDTASSDNVSSIPIMGETGETTDPQGEPASTVLDAIPDTTEFSQQEIPAVDISDTENANENGDLSMSSETQAMGSAPGLLQSDGGAVVQSDGGIMPLDVGNASLAMVNKNDGKIASAGDFSLGSKASTSFTISLSMTAHEEHETFQFTIPAGFSAAIRNVDGFTKTEETLANGDIVYSYDANTPNSTGVYECVVTVDYDRLLANAQASDPRLAYDFKVQIVSVDQTTTDMGGFTIQIPPIASYSIKQVDTLNNNFTWTPYQLAGPCDVGIVHINNQAASSRPGYMTKTLQFEIQKESGSTMQSDWSVDIPLPLYLNTNRMNSNTVELYIDGQWKTMKTMGNAFTVTAPTGAQYRPGTSTNPYGVLSSFNFTYTDELVLSLKSDMINSTTLTDTGLGTGRSIYEWLSRATAIRVNLKSDVFWDPVYNGQTAETSVLTATNLATGSVQCTADGAVTLQAGGTTTSSPAPLAMQVVNGTDTTLQVGMAAIDKIQMNVTTTKTTTGSGGSNGAIGTVNNGYAAAFGTSKNNNTYAYFTNMTASFDFPWEYSPTGEITLCPLAPNGNYENERNLTCYDYVVTITKTNGDTRTVPLTHLGYKNPVTGVCNNATPTPYTYTPDLAEDEWVSNITVTAAKVWKQSLTNDTSVLTTATRNHPLFYANCTSKGTDINGTPHQDGDIVSVTSNITTDQTGAMPEVTKEVTLIGPKDNMVIWSEDDSALKWPIGSYGESTPEYIELHAKKYSDTATYTDPYIEITGDALALLDKITYESNVGTDQAPVYHHLTLRGYRLKDGAWVDVDDSTAAALLDSAKGYYDLSGEIPDGSYLTGLRLAPLELNTAVVDTLTSPTDIDVTHPLEGQKHYQEETYYLYLYDKVYPGHLGYDDTLGQTYGNISDLNSPLSFDLTFNCDFLSGTHTGANHLKGGLTADDKRSATLVYGDLPAKITARNNDYYVQPAPAGDLYRYKYWVTELVNIAMDDGPALSTTDNYWGEMQYATLKFANDTIDEKRMLALTKGVSLVGANWTGDFSMYSPERMEHAIIRYKTNKTEEAGSGWETISSFKGTSYGDDRAVNYFDLAEDEYVTAIEIDYPKDFMYRSGYNASGTESKVQNVQLPDVGLLTKGTIPKESPVKDDNHLFENDEQLPYHAELTFTDIGGGEHTLPLTTKTAKLQPYPTMLVNQFTSSISYGSAAVNQNEELTATLTHTYNFTAETKDIDPNRVIHPTLVYQIDKNFTIADTAVLATALGVNANQITLTPKADGSGDSILKIEYGPQGPQTRVLNFTIPLTLLTKPNAATTNVTPIKNAWLTLDYDQTLNVETEGEYIDVNENSTQIEADPSSVLNISGWENGTRHALVTSLDQTININKYTASSMVFAGTDGQGGGLSQSVTGHDGTDENTFGIAETLYAPTDPSTNWVIYVAIPKENQKVPYASNQTAPASEYTLTPSADVDLKISDIGAENNSEIRYWIPNDNASLVPSFAALAVTSGDTISTLKGKDDAADDGHGSWKLWSEMSDTDKEKAAYVRIIVDKVNGEAQISSNLLMKLKAESAKTKVDDMDAYTSLVYNYVDKSGNMAFPPGTDNNKNDTGGKESSLVKYTLTDFVVSGQLWQEKKFNNTFDVSGDGDVLTKTGMTVILRDKDGNVIFHYKEKNADETDDNRVDIKVDGSYTVKVPRQGTYYLTLTATEKDWLPVIYNVGNIQNGMKFNPGIDSKGHPTSDDRVATATIVITNQDKQYINGGIEQWGTLTVEKEISGKYANLKEQFPFKVTANSGSIKRFYTAEIHTSSGGTENLDLESGTGEDISLGKGDSFTMRLPVGLGYTVTDESGSLYDAWITTKENGVSTAPVEADSVSNVIVEVTYNAEDESNGGNEEHFSNKRIEPVISGISADTAAAARMIFFSVTALLVAVVLRRKKRYKRG